MPDAGPVADIARPVRLCRRQRLGRRYFGGGFRPGAGGVASGAPGHAGIGIGADERGLSRRLSRTMAAGTGLDAGQDRKSGVEGKRVSMTLSAGWAAYN